MNTRGWKVAAALALASLMSLSSAHATDEQEEPRGLFEGEA